MYSRVRASGLPNGWPYQPSTSCGPAGPVAGPVAELEIARHRRGEAIPPPLGARCGSVAVPVVVCACARHDDFAVGAVALADRHAPVAVELQEVRQVVGAARELSGL